MRETAGVQPRINDQQVAASVQDKVYVDSNLPDFVALRVLTNGSDQLPWCERLDGAHNPLNGALRNDGGTSRLGTYERVQLVVRLLQTARKSSKP